MLFNLISTILYFIGAEYFCKKFFNFSPIQKVKDFFKKIKF